MTFRELFDELTAEAAWFAQADHYPLCADVILRNTQSRLWSSLIDDAYRRVRYTSVTFRKRCTKYRVVFEYKIPHDSDAVTHVHACDEVPLLMHSVRDKYTIWSSYPVLVKITRRQGVRIRVDWHKAFMHNGFDNLDTMYEYKTAWLLAVPANSVRIAKPPVSWDKEHSWSGDEFINDIPGY